MSAFYVFYNPSSLLTPVYAFNVLQNNKLVLYAYNYHKIRYLIKKSRILTNFPKLKKFVKNRKKFVKCPSGRGLPTTTEEYDAFHGFMLIKI